jgi:hypothetical protein
MPRVASWIGSMRKASLLKFLDDLFSTGYIDFTRSKAVPTMNDFVTSDFDKCDCLGISWFESDGSACCDVKSIAICFASIEVELWVCLDEVVM